MSLVHFWEKPGCRSNARQKIALQAAGHTVIEHNLLTESWSSQRLLDFFIDLPLAQWFNPNAPQIKSGELIPGMFDTRSALLAMQANPLLIRRPLLQIGDLHLAGFDSERLHGLIGLGILPASEACSNAEATCGG
jgi:nitrogenase-associated protein